MVIYESNCLQYNFKLSTVNGEGLEIGVNVQRLVVQGLKLGLGSKLKRPNMGVQNVKDPHLKYVLAI